MIGSVFITDKNYYPQVFLEECKSVVLRKRITDDVKISSDDESSDEENPDKKILMKKIIVKNKCLFIGYFSLKRTRCLQKYE